jgi:hypothetical protein
MERISSVLFKIYRGTPQHAEWMVACLQGAWPALVGERLAQVCRPVAFSKSTLVIEILDRDWESALKSTKRELLDKVRRATENEVLEISFRCKTVP